MTSTLVSSAIYRWATVLQNYPDVIVLLFTREIWSSHLRTFQVIITYLSLYTQVHHNLAMRMAFFGHIEPFSGVREDFELYIERLEQYLVANDLDAIELSENQSNQTAIDSRDS